MLQWYTKEDILEHPSIEWNIGADVEEKVNILSDETLQALTNLANYAMYSGRIVHVNKVDHTDSWLTEESHAVDVWIPGVTRDIMRDWAQRAGFIGGADGFEEKGMSYMEFITQPYPTPHWRESMFKFEQIEIPAPALPDFIQEPLEQVGNWFVEWGQRIGIILGGSILLIILVIALVYPRVQSVQQGVQKVREILPEKGKEETV